MSTRPSATTRRRYAFRILAAAASALALVDTPARATNLTWNVGNGNFFTRTLRWRQPLPEWLRERKASGELRIGTLSAGDLRGHVKRRLRLPHRPRQRRSIANVGDDRDDRRAVPLLQP